MNKRAVEIALRQVSAQAQLTERLRRPVFRPANPRRIYMSFVRDAGGWHCRFHLDDLRKTPISRQFVFQSAEKIYEAARRGNGLISVESRHDLDEAITIGRGGIWLRLTEDQCSALVAPGLTKPGPN